MEIGSTYCSAGDLFCKRSEGFYLMSTSTKWEGIDVGNDNRFHEIPFSLFPFYLLCDIDYQEEAMHASLSGQLDGIKFSKGEQILVSRNDEHAGNPEAELERVTIQDVKDGRIFVDQVSNEFASLLCCSAVHCLFFYRTGA